MTTAKDITDTLIKRVKNMQVFYVERYMEMPMFVGKRIPFDIKHTQGGPFVFTVYAETEREANKQVDYWIDSLEDPEC